MKKQIRKNKRETLPKLLAKSLCVAVLLSTVFACLYYDWVQQEIRRQTEQELSDRFTNLQSEINRLESDPEKKDIFQSISQYMTFQLYYEVNTPVLIWNNGNPDLLPLAPEYSENCYVAGALIDENDQIVASNRELLITHITFQKGNDPDKGVYVCDDEVLSMPEVKKLYARFDDLMAQFISANKGKDITKMDEAGWPEIHIDSAYINRETRRMIPHTGSFTVRTDTAVDPENPLIMDEETVETFEITVDDDAYELVELHRGQPSDAYPHTIMTGFYGMESNTFHELTEYWLYMQRSVCGFQSHEQYDEYYREMNYNIEGKSYNLALHFYIDPNEPVMMRHYWGTVIAVALLLCAIALLWSWRQNVVNKAKYAFDDYQRDLTNHLAYDIKTPLTAIGGYAENILDGSLSEEEQQEYLHAILDNVSFTDSLINRTLFLNSMDSAQKPKPEQLKAEQVTESILKKYELMLSERGIGYSVKGSAALTADRAALETVIENLVSNAVKYTPHEGSIKAVLEKKRLTLTNTVDKKVATGNLKRPFVRGDEARSNTEGTGLGLAIAERAAAANGWKLTLSCNDSEFTAELKF